MHAISNLQEKLKTEIFFFENKLYEGSSSRNVISNIPKTSLLFNPSDQTLARTDCIKVYQHCVMSLTIKLIHEIM